MHRLLSSGNSRAGILELIMEDSQKMNKLPVILVVLTYAIFSISTAFSDTLNIPAQHPDIHSALESIQPGDIIEIAPGTYYESNLSIPAGIIIRGTGANPGEVVIDAEGSGRIMILEGLDSSTTIQNITFRNGHASGDNSYDQSGGAIYCSNSQAAILDCNFIANEADSHGGAVRCNNSSPTIMNCTFSGNSAPSGGGGAIDCSYNSHPLLQDCTFVNNTADWGAGLSCRGGSSPEVNGAFFDSNTASGTASLGGGAFADYQSMPSFFKATFCENSADYGGAIACLAESATNLENCTIVGNEAHLEGGGIFLFEAYPSVAGSLITFNEGNAIATLGTALPEISCTDIFGNSLGDWVGAFDSQETNQGNLSVDPQFCTRAPGEITRFHVSGDSPVAKENGFCELMGSMPVGCDLTSDTGLVPDHPGVGQISAAPNPFNPRTSIKFELGQSQRVQVSVFNLQGALVRKLVDDEFASGPHSVQWNGDDEAGRAIGSGAYIVVIQGEQDRQTLKMTMLK